MLSDAALREHLERIVPLQEVFNESLDSLNEVKREARSDGLSTDALNAFLPILVRNPHDKGARVLNEVFCYAEALGIETFVSKAVADSQPPAEPAREVQDSQPATANIPPPVESKRKLAALAWFRLSSQVVAAVSLSIGLIWLLN